MTYAGEAVRNVVAMVITVAGVMIALVVGAGTVGILIYVLQAV